MPYSWAVWMGFAVWRFHILYLKQAGPWADPSKKWRFWTRGKVSGESQETVNEEDSCLIGEAWSSLAHAPHKVEDFTNPLEWLIET